jgi:hypothetical protein
MFKKLDLGFWRRMGEDVCMKKLWKEFEGSDF